MVAASALRDGSPVAASDHAAAMPPSRLRRDIGAKVLWRSRPGRFRSEPCMMMSSIVLCGRFGAVARRFG